MRTIIGITGTRKGATTTQLNELSSFLKMQTGFIIRHGACVGADEQVVELATNLKLQSDIQFIDGIWIIAHPPDLQGPYFSTRAIGLSNLVLYPKPFIERNHRIVAESKNLVALPETDKEELRSGTWATVRYAKRIKVPCMIIYPDGRIEHE